MVSRFEYLGYLSQVSGNIGKMTGKIIARIDQANLIMNPQYPETNSKMCSMLMAKDIGLIISQDYEANRLVRLESLSKPKEPCLITLSKSGRNIIVKSQYGVASDVVVSIYVDYRTGEGNEISVTLRRSSNTVTVSSTAPNLNFAPEIVDIQPQEDSYYKYYS